MAVPLCLSLSLNDLPVHCPSPDLNRTMSLPSAKKRLRIFRRDSLKRRKTAPDNDVAVRTGDNSRPPSVVSTEDIVNKDNEDQFTVPAVYRTPSPTRRKLERLLSRTSKLFNFTAYRNDSVVLSSKDTRKGLKRALQDANHIVAGPEGEVLPAYVIDDFFKLNSAGGSGWQQSWQWDAHLDRWEGHKAHRSDGDRIYCVYCRKLYMEGHELPPPYVILSPPASSTNSSFDHDSSSEPRGSEDSNLSTLIWQRISRRRVDKGKETAPDEPWCEVHHELPVSPRTQASELQLDRSGARASEVELTRCPISANPVDLHQVPIPTAPSPSKDCIVVDVSDPSHLTGGLYGAYPLPRNTQPPPAPELRPAQRHTPVPGSFRLENPSGLSTDAAFKPNSREKCNSNTTKVIRGGFPGPITLVTTSSTTASDAMSVLLNQYRHEPAPAKLQKRRPQHRSPSPLRNPLPTPPDSRNNSDAHHCGVASVPEVTFGATGSLPVRPAGPRRRTTGPADRDARVCTLSDTTGSPLREYAEYVDRREKKTRKNEQARWRQWPGMSYWRYRPESEDED
jgi:hypothetical protein